MAKVRWKGMAALVAIMILLGPLLVFLGGPDHSTHALQCVLANTALAAPIAFAVTAIAELLVAAIARILGDRVRAITIGFGPYVRKLEIGGLFVGIAMFPTSGETIFATVRLEGLQRRITIARCGAAAAITLLAAYLVRCQGSLQSSLTQHVPSLTMVGVLALWTVINSTLRKYSPDSLREMYVAGLLLQGQQRYEQGAFKIAEQLAREALRTMPEDPGALLCLAMALSERASTESLAIADRLRRHEHPAVRRIANNQWAWQAYLLGDESRRVEAERAIADAASPTAKPTTSGAVLDTRAHIALWGRRYADAERDFLASLSTKHRKAAGRMSSAAGMAMVCAATDRHDEARAWLAKARAEGIEHDLLARATAAVEPLSR